MWTGYFLISPSRSGRYRVGNRSARFWTITIPRLLLLTVTFGFPPVLEVLNPDTLGSDGMKAVTLRPERRQAGRQLDAIQIVVKNGSTFTAPCPTV